jgi:outer membrane protein TolC
MVFNNSKLMVVSRLTLALAFVSRAALGQPAPAPAPAPAAPVVAPPATAVAPTSTTPGAAPAPIDVPESRTTGELKKRFDALRSGKGLTPDEAARRTLKNSAALEAKQRALESVDAQASQTMWAFSPKVKLGASYTRLSPVDSKINLGPRPTDPIQQAVYDVLNQGFSSLTNIPVNSTVFDANLSVPLSDYVLRLSHAQTGADRARDAAVFDRGATYAAVDRDARVYYYGWVRAQAQEIIGAQNLEQANGHLKDAQNAFQAGLVSKAEVLSAQVAQKNAELLVERAKNNTELARLTLEVYMGDAPGQKYEIGEDVFAPNPALDALPESATAVREAERQRMEFKSLVAAEQAQRERAALERVADYPRLDGIAGAMYANPNQRYFPLKQEFNLSWQAGVALTWTPTDIGGAEAARDASLARAAELAAQKRQVHDGLRIEVDQALKAAREARFTIDVAGDALAASEESYRVRRELFRAGRATSVELTDAETELTRTRLQLADAHVNARIALVQLNHALGRDTEPARAAARKPAQTP